MQALGGRAEGKHKRADPRWHRGDKVPMRYVVEVSECSEPGPARAKTHVYDTWWAGSGDVP
eukprot:1047447-Pyramimonas_sp.AAC.1